jgi:hypothetical protein
MGRVLVVKPAGVATISSAGKQMTVEIKFDVGSGHPSQEESPTGAGGLASGRKDKKEADAKLGAMGIDGTVRAETLDLETSGNPPAIMRPILGIILVVVDQIDEMI